MVAVVTLIIPSSVLRHNCAARSAKVPGCFLRIFVEASILNMGLSFLTTVEGASLIDWWPGTFAMTASSVFKANIVLEEQDDGFHRRERVALHPPILQMRKCAGCYTADL
jgi:hypothetical protein